MGVSCQSNTTSHLETCSRLWSWIGHMFYCNIEMCNVHSNQTTNSDKKLIHPMHLWHKDWLKINLVLSDWDDTMSPSQRSISVGNIVDCATEPLCERNVTHVSCDNLDKKVKRAPPPPPPRLSSLHRAPSQALMHYTTVPQSLVSRLERAGRLFSGMLLVICKGINKGAEACLLLS